MPPLDLVAKAVSIASFDPLKKAKGDLLAKILVMTIRYINVIWTITAIARVKTNNAKEVKAS